MLPSTRLILLSKIFGGVAYPINPFRLLFVLNGLLLSLFHRQGHRLGEEPDLFEKADDPLANEF